ncbi:Hypothetical protein R9X50_00126100 [Acrodontium crateriforme]|uniref:PHD-type domain-containing protein n=1 Tax=Acrodontium crateriforme TaxID=150365 RepID=A0AAQ3R7R8_9PEZI|nr:Hypothetical protein R9X50_00126100 [Acrodontium crateriforme]
MTTLAPGSDFRSLSRQPPTDPDIHATLSDFLTYTEHFPSQLTRALTLIEEQRTRAEERIAEIHKNTTLYSILPTIEDDRPNPVQLRRDISYALEEAERASRMALAEAIRMAETSHKEAARLDAVTKKLKAQPMPPSRDPTPEQQALTSPNLKRERLGTHPLEGVREKQSRRLDDKAATKLRGRKIMVPGEVLPPPDPNAPPESISDWTSPRASPPLEEPPGSDKKVTPRPRSRTPKPFKSDKERDRKDKSLKPRGPRAPGQPGTNAHSSIAGISTSNALLALTPPPEGAMNGSKWLPWMKLTEWEMAKLRKRMKKNAIWVPSQTMVRRELKNLGRGVAGKELARLAAEAGGPPFLDEGTESDPTKILVSGTDSDMMTLYTSQAIDEDDDADAELINRGMRLNEAKKLKRQRMLEEQALQAQLAREQGVEAPTDSKAATGSPEAQKKRKRETTPTVAGPVGLPDTPDPLSKAGPPPKKLKILPSSTVPGPSSTKIPLAPAGASSSPKGTAARSRRAATPPASRGPVLVLKKSKAVSEEPPERRATLRRGSNASLPNAPTTSSPNRNATVSTGRRRKRPAPGALVNSNDDGSTKVGISRRKAAPKKKVSLLLKPPNAEPEVDGLLPAFEPAEYVDPDEPRYCVCNNVSWGTMIACDNDDCEREWFHLSCVDLTELPPRRTKWYCPDCRKKLKVGQGSNGLVGRAQGR